MLDLIDTFLDAKRLRGDAAGDEVAARLISEGAVGAVDICFKSLQRNDQAVPDGVQAYVKTSFDEGARLPAEG